MGAFVAFFGMLLLSLVASLIAALQLGDFFGAGDEFLFLIAYLAAFGTATMVILAIGARLAPSVRVISGLAFVLALLALVPPAIPAFVHRIAEHATNPYTIGVERTYIRVELLIPALLAVLVQWGLVRGRWLRAVGQEELTLWPWVSTVIAGLVILNPLGLTFLTAALKRSPNDPLWQPAAIATGAVLVVLLVMAWAECYIRDRILDRRLSKGSPDAGENKRNGE